jgi:hypothetical protein
MVKMSKPLDPHCTHPNAYIIWRTIEEPSKEEVDIMKCSSCCLIFIRRVKKNE